MGYSKNKDTKIIQYDDTALVSQLAQKATNAEVDTKVAQIVSGSPKNVYATLAALQTAFPTGATGIYLVTADGKWYFWNGSAWTAGGTYQATGIGNSSVSLDSFDSTVKGFIANSIADNEVDTKQLFLQEGSKIKAIGGINDGTNVWTEVARATMSYIDLPSNTPFNKRDVPKATRFSYNIDTNSYAYFMNNINTTTSIVFGVWIRKSDIQSLPSAANISPQLIFRRNAGTTAVQTLTFTKTEVQTVGTTKTGTADIVTTTAKIASSYGDWIFLQVTTDKPLDDQYRISLYLRVTGLAIGNTGKLDLVNYTVLVGETSINPYFVYKTTTQVAPATNIDLDQRTTSLDGRVTTIENLSSSLVGVTKVIKSGQYLYIRTPWDSTYDLIQKIDTLSANPTDFDNPIINFWSYGLLAKTKVDSDVPTATLTTVKTSTDDATPSFFNGTYIGANHGGSYVREVVANNHGKTVQDVGSEWLDGATQKFYIMRIVDVNTLWLMSKNADTGSDWTFLYISGTTLTHSSGATNTAPITIASVTNTQLKPSINNQTKKYLLDGKKEIVNDGIYTCEHFDIINSYNIVDLPSVVEFVISKVGSSTQPSFVDSTIASVARIGITYKFDQYGSCVVYQNFQANKNLTMDGYLGFIQAGPVIIPSGGTLNQYVPKSLPITVGANTYNLKNIADITNLSASLELTTDKWETPNSPPDRYVQFAKQSNGAINNNFGFILGYCPDYSAGKPELRKSAITSAMLMSSSKKTYPKAISQGGTFTNDIIPAGTNVEVVAYRNAINYNLDLDATNISWYSVGKNIYLMLDYHKNVSKTLTLPASFIGKKIEVIEKNTDFILKNEFINPDGLLFEVKNGYGYAVLRLS